MSISSRMYGMDQVILKTVGETIRVGYSGKALGNTHGKFSPDAVSNLAKFIASFPGKTAYNMPGVSKDNIVDVDKITPDELQQMAADGLITKKPDVVLVLKAADCIPLAFYVPGQKILAFAHVGVGGAALHLPAKVIKQMGCPVEQIKCYVGPSISRKSYRFEGHDISGKNLDPSWDRYISDEPDGIHINLLGYVLDELKNAGIPAENIELDKIDTGSDPDYFSHRRHKLSGEPDGRNTFAACLI